LVVGIRELSIIHTDLKLENVMLTKPLVSRPAIDVNTILKMQTPQLDRNLVANNGKLSKNQKRRMKAKLRKHAKLSGSTISPVWIFHRF